MSRSEPREFLLDVSRLVWRVWSGRLPTGIDRVCLEYVGHFGSRSQAVVQFAGSVWVLSPDDSDRLYSCLQSSGGGHRAKLIAIAPRAWVNASRYPPHKGMLYLNVGHTGLHNSALPGWLQANRVRAVYLIHDLIPLTHPEFCRTGEAAKHALRMQNALSSATAIIGNSRATLRELAAFARARGLPMPPNRAIWISGQRSLADVRAIRLGRPHFVTVGTIEGRKNHILLLRIWQNLIAEMKENAPALLILGQRGWAAEATWALLDNLAELKGHVRELGSCNDAELAGWVAGAQALLMPSFAEGFGLPIIEALQLGTPVVASDLDVYREIAGDIPAYVDPNDAAAWENAIRILLVDGWERERRKRAMHGYRPPDWPGHFAAVERWLRDL